MPRMDDCRATRCRARTATGRISAALSLATRNLYSDLVMML